MIQCRLAICARGDGARGAKFGGGAGCGVPGASGRLAARARCPSDVEAVLACPPNVRISCPLAGHGRVPQSINQTLVTPGTISTAATRVPAPWDDMKRHFHVVPAY